MRNGVSYLVYIYTLGAGRIFIKSIIIVCLLNLMAWKASWAHRTGENEEEKKDDEIKIRSKRRAPVVLPNPRGLGLFSCLIPLWAEY